MWRANLADGTMLLLAHCLTIDSCLMIVMNCYMLKLSSHSICLNKCYLTGCHSFWLRHFHIIYMLLLLLVKYAFVIVVIMLWFTKIDQWIRSGSLKITGKIKECKY